MRPVEMKSIEAVPGLEPLTGADRLADNAARVDFGAELSSALASVEQTQVDADQQSEKAALGGGNLHELAISLEKADVAMRVATKVRNKLVDAYHEIMRMSI